MVSRVFLALGICFLYFCGVPVSYRTGRLGGLIFLFFLKLSSCEVFEDLAMGLSVRSTQLP